MNENNILYIADFGDGKIMKDNLASLNKFNDRNLLTHQVTKYSFVKLLNEANLFMLKQKEINKKSINITYSSFERLVRSV